MCIMKQSDQILSRSFLCSLVLRSSGKGLCLYFAFHHFVSLTRLLLNKEKKKNEQKICGGTIYSDGGSQRRRTRMQRVTPSGFADRHMQLDFVLKNVWKFLERRFLCCVFFLMSWFLSW